MTLFKITNKLEQLEAAKLIGSLTEQIACLESVALRPDIQLVDVAAVLIASTNPFIQEVVEDVRTRAYDGKQGAAQIISSNQDFDKNVRILAAYYSQVIQILKTMNGELMSFATDDAPSADSRQTYDAQATKLAIMFEKITSFTATGGEMELTVSGLNQTKERVYNLDGATKLFTLRTILTIDTSLGGHPNLATMSNIASFDSASMTFPYTAVAAAELAKSSQNAQAALNDQVAMLEGQAMIVELQVGHLSTASEIRSQRLSRKVAVAQAHLTGALRGAEAKQHLFSCC